MDEAGRKSRDSDIFNEIDALLKSSPPKIDDAVYNMKRHIDISGTTWMAQWDRIQQVPTNLSDFKNTLLVAHERQEYQPIIDILSKKNTTFVPRDELASFEDTVEGFLYPLHDNMHMIVDGRRGLKMWVPQKNGDHDEFLRTLNIPLDSHMKPDMLLHDLGLLTRDPSIRQRLKEIFTGKESHTFVVNTSGSGKTRLVYEGLCRFWGLYFTALRDSSGHGSRDIEMIISTALRSCPTFTDPLPPHDHPSFMAALKNNQVVAEMFFKFALLARLRVLHLFVDAMYAIPQLEPMDVYRKRWLMLQIKPALLSDDGSDVFTELTHKMIPYLDRVTPREVERAINREISFIQGKTKTIPDTFYIALDEAQSAAEQYFTAFVSSSNSRVQRPVLRHWLLAWLPYNAALIVTGTGVSATVIKETMSSVVAKYTHYSSVSDIGVFTTVDDIDSAVQSLATSQGEPSYDDQLAYVLRFIPPYMHSHDSTIRLLKRLAHWLHGRFRFTAAYISELIEAELETPHRLLNEYVKEMTKPPPSDRRSVVQTESTSIPGFWPSDSAEYVEESGNFNLSARTTFNFQKLLECHQDELATIANVATRFWLRMDLKNPNITKYEADFVQMGFARFHQKPGDQGPPSSQLNEPIPLLALGQWLNSGFHESIHHRLTTTIGTHNASGENTLENYLGFCLTRLLDGSNRLDEVFCFPKKASAAWAAQRAQLVSLHRADSSSPIQESLVTFASRPSHSIGTHAPTPTAMVEWLKHERDAPICFPPATMGPDVFFIVKLEDGSRIWVAIQSKYCSEALLNAETLRDSIRSVTPSTYFSSVKGDRTVDLLLELPDRRTDVGKYSLLRVVTSFPGETRLQRATTTLNKKAPVPFYDDDEEHPIASMDIDLLGEVTKNMKPKDYVNDFKHPQKRKLAYDDADSPPSKRTRNNDGTVRKGAEPRRGRSTSATQPSASVASGSRANDYDGTNYSPPVTPTEQSRESSVFSRAGRGQ
ncbi:hypothetical protein B0H11DRAFT_1034481 [Mycena galericulata]|nr:hypothetical protein B0H11DRAFT_1034481 [Mycena galericulata]